jgi:hypothetical protein
MQSRCLFDKPRGRFRPVVRAIESVIGNNREDTWDKSIKVTLDSLSSMAQQELRGNLCGEIPHLERKIREENENMVEEDTVMSKSTELEPAGTDSDLDSTATYETNSNSDSNLETDPDAKQG